MNGNFGGGAGTATDPYVIQDVADFQRIRDLYTSHFMLANDIDLIAYANFPSLTNSVSYFTGSLNGNGHKILNLTMNTAEPETGMFRKIVGATIKNVTFENAKVTGIDNCAVISALQDTAIFDNIAFIGCTMNVGGARAGLIVADTGTTPATISNITAITCRIDGTFAGACYIGGLVGDGGSTGNLSNVSYCDLQIDINSAGNIVGGIAGQAEKFAIDSVTVRSQISSTFDGTAQLGGFVGLSGTASSPSMTKCKFKGSVYGRGVNVGGFIGYLKSGVNPSWNIQKSSFDGTVEGQGYVGGFIGMADASSMVTNLNQCFVRGQVISRSDFAGAFVGSSKRITMQNCYARADVTSATVTNSGGACGYAINTTIVNCYTVVKMVNLGNGFIGTLGTAVAITNSFNDITYGTSQTISGLSNKTTAEMKVQTMYAGVSWDFTNIWSMIDYPQLYEAPEDDRFGITGVVSINKVPVSGATVILFGKDRLYQKVKTDAQGRYTFRGILPERYFSVVAHYTDGANWFVSTSVPNVLPIVLI